MELIDELSDRNSEKRKLLARPLACGRDKIKTMTIDGEKRLVTQVFQHGGHGELRKEKKGQWYICYEHRLILSSKEKFNASELPCRWISCPYRIASYSDIWRNGDSVFRPA
jgi:hypothetical protein